MSHLRKKIENYLWEANINIWCRFNPIINKNCLEFYEYDHGKEKHLFYYLYDKTKNLKENIKLIKQNAVKYGNFIEIEKCKYSKKFMKVCEFEECQKNCFYKNYCKIIIPDPFIYTIDGKEVEKDEFINYVIFKMKEGESNV